MKIQKTDINDIDSLINIWERTSIDSPWFKSNKIMYPSHAEELKSIEDTLLNKNNKSWKILR